ncbi:dynein axonemal heavy chain 5-like, partial [Manacus candei]|uniref:dynein axonemal heavy chain 5-like n=1 Tax=Manacus candei TaxID=415023 RepID=UPI002227805E
VSMVDAIPGLINTIKMIQSISQYYNTSEKISSLFVKVTNQMITACKSYIANNDTTTIWNQPQERVMEKLQAAIRLKQEYQNCFRKIKENLEQNPAERQFDFSEIYIFGKFETFHRRLIKIIDIFNTMKTYSVLQESKIEGLEGMITKYESIVDNIKSKHYNFLDQRKTDFDQDYEEFCREINDLHDQLRIFMDITLENILNTQRALSMLQKFERLQIPNLGIDEKYQKIFQNYGHDIETVCKIYSRHKQDPPLARNLPPIAGKILWARHLFHRIQEPMETFQRRPAVLQTPDGKRIIRSYNKVAKVLMKFEVIYHKEWLQQIELIKRGLQATLLVKAPETGELFVNFDPQILTLIRETDCMAHMCLEIPPFASIIQHQRDWYKKIVNNLHVMLAEYKRIKLKIQHPIEQLMVPQLANIDDAIKPGLMLLTWTSLNIEKYINTVFYKLAGLELLLDRVNDLVEFRIDAVLQEMNRVPLCKLPEEEPLSCEEFLQKTKELCVKGSQSLHLKSSLVEAAANDLIDMLLDTEVQISKEDERSLVPSGEKKLKNTATEEERRSKSLNFSQNSSEIWADLSPTAKRKRMDLEKLEEEANELLSYFNNRNIDALLKVIRNTLETLRKRIHTSSTINFLENQSASKQKKGACPMIRTSINLSIPNIIMTPSLDEVQQMLNKAVNSIVKVMKGVGQWSKERRSKKKMLERKVAVLRCESRDSDSDDGMKETGKKHIHGNDKL